MRTIFSSISSNWAVYIIPAAVFIISMIVSFWLRKISLNYLNRWAEKIKWTEENFLVQSIKGPSSLLCLILSVYLALVVSTIPSGWKSLAGSGLWTLFVIALTLSLLSLTRSISLHYGRKFNLPNRVIMVFRNAGRIVVLVITVLIVMDIWGIPTSPLLLLIAVAIFIAALAFRDSVPNLFASFQIAATGEFKIGDYVKLENNEAGYITEISWNRTTLKSLDGSTILVPNEILVRQRVINYGHPLKKARQPFRFNSQPYQAALTGVQTRYCPELAAILTPPAHNSPALTTTYIAHDLREFVEALRKITPSSLYFHVYESRLDWKNGSNDFTVWLANDLDEKELSQEIAGIDLNSCSLEGLRSQLIQTIEKHIK